MAGTLARRFRLTRGKAAEHQAERHLRARGLQLVKRNYRCRMGEIDLIMREGDCLVIVEVRYRKSDTFLSPALTVDESKQARIIRTTEHFLAASPALADYAIRFDVVAIGGTQSRTGAIQWIKDAFRV